MRQDQIHAYGGYWLWTLHPAFGMRLAGSVALLDPGVQRPGVMGQRQPHWARRPGLERRNPGVEGGSPLLGTLRRRLRDVCTPGEAGPLGSSWCRRVKVLSVANGAA